MTTILVGNDLMIDVAKRRVFKHDVELSLPERSYRLLLTLVESAPNIVSHDDLIKAVWPDRVISDENLKQRISRLRRALDDPSDKPNYIVAERGLGYRCIATVKSQVETEVKVEAKPVAMPTRWQAHKTKIIGALGIIVLGIIVFIATMMMNPVEPIPVAKVGEFTAVDYSNQAQQYYYRFKPSDNFTAIDLYQKAIETDPNYSFAYAGLANAHAQAYYQYGQGEDALQQAIKYSNRAIEIAPNQAWGYKSLGLTYHLSGHFNAAIAAYDKAIERAPWWSSPVNNSAFVHQEAGRLVKAYQQVLTAIKMDTKDPIPYLFQGLVYRDLGMAAHALKAFNRAIELKPDYLLAQNYLAEYYLSVGDYRQALLMVEKTIARATQNQFAHWLNAHIQLQMGNKVKAIEHFTQTATLGGRHLLIAQIYLAVLRQDNPQLLQLAEQTNSAIAQGNQWPELIYAQGLLALANQDNDRAILSFGQAVDAGLRPFYLQGNAILSSELTTLPAFKALVLKQTQKLAKARGQVMILEQKQ